MSLYINQNSTTKIYKSDNKEMNHSNQEFFRENYLQTLIHEQRQLNKRIANEASSSAKINEAYQQALLEQISHQEKLLQEMHQKILEYEQTTTSLYEQMEEQAKINDTLKQQHVLQNVYHQKTMVRFGQQEDLLKEQLEKQEQNVIGHFQKQHEQFHVYFQKHENVFAESAKEQKVLINELIDDQFELLNEQIQLQESKITKQYDANQTRLIEHLEKQDANIEKLERKLDFLKETIFERAADFSEKLDKQMRKLTRLFTHWFAKQDHPHEKNDLNESASNEREKLNI